MQEAQDFLLLFGHQRCVGTEGFEKGLVGDVRGKQMRILQNEFREAIDALDEQRRLDARTTRDKLVQIKREITFYNIACSPSAPMAQI